MHPRWGFVVARSHMAAAPMLRRTPCTQRAAWALPHGIGQPKTWLRRHVSTSSDVPEWFPQLRAEMLAREVTILPDHLTVPPEYRLSQTLRGFLPREWCHSPGRNRPIVPVGHHLIWFNPTLPTHDLLPDGTDASHSPGGPWVRRMWAGGSVQVKPGEYYDKFRGFVVDTPMAGTEHIKDVQLRGQGDAAKIFVTIERRFARVERLQSNRTKWQSKKYLEMQMPNEKEWGDAILREERNLVFFKERTADELGAIKAGTMAPVKYLSPPAAPTFAHALTPNRALLFRFSALTFNAHLIHLDPNYARNIEGHRNLLVHGPLALTLMLQVMHNYIDKHTKGKQVVESIDYRNLAPLYCDEEMRICGLEKKTLQNGSIYDIWIEGPTGGMAVKGTVYTTVRTAQSTPSSSRRELRHSTGGKDTQTAQPSFRRLHLESAEPEPTAKKETVEPQPSIESEGENSQNPALTEASSPSPFREVIASPAQALSRADRRMKATRVKYHKFIVPSPPPIRPVEPYKLGRPFMTAQSKHILRRLLREPMPKAIDHTTPLPIFRKYAVSPHTLSPERTASRHSRFLREGARRIDRPSIRQVGDARHVVKARIRKWHH